MERPSTELLEAFFAWFRVHSHAQNEDYYTGQITRNALSSLERTKFIEFFTQFARDGGKVQSGGHRTAPKFQKTIEESYDAFHAFALEPFEQGFDALQWLNRTNEFPGFGQGLSTIYLNRVDKKRFAIVNKKAIEAMSLLGVAVSGTRAERFRIIRDAERQLIQWYPEFDNFYRADALTQFLIGEPDGQKWADRLRGQLSQSWIYAPGERARLWTKYRAEGMMGIGWNELNQDLSQVQDEEELREMYDAAYGDNASDLDFRQLCDFVLKMRKGDRVFVKRGTGEIVGYGLVASDYFFDQARAEYRHLRSATWQKDGVWTIPGSEKALPVKTLTEVKDPARRQWLLALINETGTKSEESKQEEDLAVLIENLLRRFLAQAKDGKELSVQGYPAEYRGLEIKVSFGKGNLARIPWIAFLGEGQAVSNGIYPVLLLFRQENMLLLCYGVSEENQAARSWGDLGATLTVRAWFNAKYGRDPDRYGESHVLAQYDLNVELPVQELVQQLDSMIDRYRTLVGGKDNGVLPKRPDIFEAVASFSSAIRESFVSFGEDHNSLVATFIASIVTKPLVILTGLSGSGKTQLAIKLGQWLGENALHVAAVRPDWTGAEALFGYEDGLKPVVDGRAAWLVPAPLEFMLKACADTQHPYLLLLDEMNLAHVERYFADALSGMESGEPCLPNLVRGPDGLWRAKPEATTRVPFPRNLWLVGTVNVDETTYMFSPKVLDRATTFEFRVATKDLQSAARKPIRCAIGDPSLVRGLLSIAQNDQWHRENPTSFGVELEDKLKQLHRVLARYSLEFGHRVFYDSIRFSAFAEKAGVGGLEPVLDRIVLQRVLPRLHGSRRRLELPILALAHFCRDLPEAVESDQKLPALTVDSLGVVAARLPHSYDKLCRLLRNLRANQFASFTE